VNGKVAAIDRYCGPRSRKWLKRSKAKFERRAARRDPERAPAYGKYVGWNT